MRHSPFVFAITLTLCACPLERCDGGGGEEECVPSAREKWAFVQSDTGFYYSSPAIGPDGTVFVGSGTYLMATQRSADGYYLFAFNPDGTIKWKASTGTPERSSQRSYVRGAPAVASDGSIYFVVDYAPQDFGSVGYDPWAGALFVYKVDKEGQKQWELKVRTSTPETGQWTPAIGANGTVYVGAFSGLLAIDPDGSVKWNIVGGGMFSPIVGPDGTIYTACPQEAETAWRARICAVSDDGTQGTVKWKSPGLAYAFSSSPALGSDGTVYVASVDERSDLNAENHSTLFALSGADGTIRWAFRTPDDVVRDPVMSSPAVGRDGTIYFGTRAAGTFYAVNPDGTLKWSYTVVGPPYAHADFYSSPAIGADGTVYVGNEFDGLLAFNPDGTLAWREGELGCVGISINYSSPALAADGTLYVGTNSGVFAAVKTDSPGPDPDAPWPKFRYDDANSGRKP